MTAWFLAPISHGYYGAYDPKTPDTPHYAVDIGEPVDTPITALKSGKVVQADYAVWNGEPGGGEVFIKPDDGSTEYYYYHFDQNKVSAGQHVNAGDVVGLSGGQNSGGSHPTSTAWSTGPHVHVGYFTSFINTPVGTRPTGPDITPTINYLKIGGNYGGGTPTQAASDSTSSGFPSLASVGTRIGVFLLALVILAGGAYFIFHKQIDAAIAKGKDEAVKAAMLA
jgi:murein DD-endopeptidase MepM/ murein hydrolase activator NlpD